MNSAEDFKPKHLLALDSVQSRLDIAKAAGAEPWDYQKEPEALNERVMQLTDGRGADAVIGRS